MLNPKEISAVAITDCGSTTTKALLVEKVDGVFRQTARGDAPTTVESPHLDITVGVKGALRNIEGMSGRTLLDETGEIIRPARNGKGVDLYLSTSSAGGGLQMAVAGLVRKLSAKAAERAALGAGAIVSHVAACDDDAPLHTQIEALRTARPDMMLVAGGTDGGAFEPVVEIAELLAAAAPKSRLGKSYRLPVIFAGNRDAAEAVRRALPQETSVFIEENVLRTVDEENLAAARERVHTLFLEHVMQQAPGFGRLAELTDTPVMPTPSAAADMLSLLWEAGRENTLLVDIGGATTDVFSMIRGNLTRTVSANLGMSYSAARVLIEAGADAIMRWLPFAVDGGALTDMIMNKTVRPTTVPDTREELLVEQALAREALGLSSLHHAAFAGQASEENGVNVFRTATDTRGFSMMDVDLLIGSGGVISHAPTPLHAAQMLVDGLAPEGVTRLVRDGLFMMPHLGVLSRVHREAALSVFERDCIEPLGTSVAPRGSAAPGKVCLTGVLETEGGREEIVLRAGEVKRLPLPVGTTATLRLSPSRRFDVGAGKGKPRVCSVAGGPAGVLFDGRGRPFRHPESVERVETVRRWFEGFGVPVDEEERS